MKGDYTERERERKRERETLTVSDRERERWAVSRGLAEVGQTPANRNFLSLSVNELLELALCAVEFSRFQTQSEQTACHRQCLDWFPSFQAAVSLRWARLKSSWSCISDISVLPTLCQHFVCVSVLLQHGSAPKSIPVTTKAAHHFKFVDLKLETVYTIEMCIWMCFKVRTVIDNDVKHVADCFNSSESSSPWESTKTV